MNIGEFHERCNQPKRTHFQEQARRDGTLTVKELIATLQQFHSDLPVYVHSSALRYIAQEHDDIGAFVEIGNYTQKEIGK